MLDAFKSKSGATKLQSDELQTLIAASKEERAALSTMLTQVQLHSAKLASPPARRCRRSRRRPARRRHRLDEVNDRLNKAAKRASRSSRRSTPASSR